MNTFDEQDDLTFDDKLDTQRDIIRQSLAEIANDIGMAMRDVGLNFPLYMTVRNSGDALVTIATTLDPSDADGHRHLPSSVGLYKKRLAAVGYADKHCLRYCERRGDKCDRRDGRLILFHKSDRHRSPAVSIVPLRGCPGAVCLGSASVKCTALAV